MNAVTNFSCVYQKYFHIKISQKNIIERNIYVKLHKRNISDCVHSKIFPTIWFYGKQITNFHVMFFV